MVALSPNLSSLPQLFQSTLFTTIPQHSHTLHQPCSISNHSSSVFYQSFVLFVVPSSLFTTHCRATIGVPWVRQPRLSIDHPQLLTALHGSFSICDRSSPAFYSSFIFFIILPLHFTTLRCSSTTCHHTSIGLHASIFTNQPHHFHYSPFPDSLKSAPVLTPYGDQLDSMP